MENNDGQRLNSPQDYSPQNPPDLQFCNPSNFFSGQDFASQTSPQYEYPAAFLSPVGSTISSPPSEPGQHQDEISVVDQGLAANSGLSPCQGQVNLNPCQVQSTLSSSRNPGNPHPNQGQVPVYLAGQHTENPLPAQRQLGQPQAASPSYQGQGAYRAQQGPPPVTQQYRSFGYQGAQSHQLGAQVSRAHPNQASVQSAGRTTANQQHGFQVQHQLSLSPPTPTSSGHPQPTYQSIHQPANQRGHQPANQGPPQAANQSPQSTTVQSGVTQGQVFWIGKVPHIYISGRAYQLGPASFPVQPGPPQAQQAPAQPQQQQQYQAQQFQAYQQMGQMESRSAKRPAASEISFGHSEESLSSIGEGFEIINGPNLASMMEELGPISQDAAQFDLTDLVPSEREDSVESVNRDMALFGRDLWYQKLEMQHSMAGGQAERERVEELWRTNNWDNRNQLNFFRAANLLNRHIHMVDKKWMTNWNEDFIRSLIELTVAPPLVIMQQGEAKPGKGNKPQQNPKENTVHPDWKITLKLLGGQSVSEKLRLSAVKFAFANRKKAAEFIRGESNIENCTAGSWKIKGEKKEGREPAAAQRNKKSRSAEPNEPEYSEVTAKRILKVSFPQNENQNDKIDLCVKITDIDDPDRSKPEGQKKKGAVIDQNSDVHKFVPEKSYFLIWTLVVTVSRGEGLDYPVQVRGHSPPFAVVTAGKEEEQAFGEKFWLYLSNHNTLLTPSFQGTDYVRVEEGPVKKFLRLHFSQLAEVPRLWNGANWISGRITRHLDEESLRHLWEQFCEPGRRDTSKQRLLTAKMRILKINSSTTEHATFYQHLYACAKMIPKFRLTEPWNAGFFVPFTKKDALERKLQYCSDGHKIAGVRFRDTALSCLAVTSYDPTLPGPNKYNHEELTATSMADASFAYKIKHGANLKDLKRFFCADALARIKTAESFFDIVHVETKLTVVPYTPLQTNPEIGPEQEAMEEAAAHGVCPSAEFGQQHLEHCDFDPNIPGPSHA